MDQDKKTSPAEPATSPGPSPLVKVLRLYSYACAVAVPLALAAWLWPIPVQPPATTQPRTVKPDPPQPPKDEHPGLIFVGGDHWIFTDRAQTYLTNKVNADAVASVVEWNAWCKEHGARLVLVAVPDRGYLLRAGVPGPPLVRTHMEAAYQAMREAGVDVLDAGTILTAEDCALQDSHMRPSSFRRVAQFVAEHVKGFDFGVSPAKITFRDAMVWEAGEMSEQAHVPLIRTSDETVCVFFDSAEAAEGPLVIMGDSNAFFYQEMHTSFSQQLGGMLRVVPNVIARADDGSGLQSRAVFIREHLKPKLVIWIFDEFALVNRKWR